VHSAGSKLDIHLAYDGDFTLRVSDDGKGFATEATAKGKEGHFGLQGMRERAARIDATLTILAPRGGGTRVELAVPERVAFRNAGS
jgi:signal transduction histidine kinase